MFMTGLCYMYTNLYYFRSTCNPSYRGGGNICYATCPSHNILEKVSDILNHIVI